MTALEQPSRNRQRPRRPKRAWPRLLAIVLAAVMLFAVGVAFGMALRDDPEPGGTQTIVRTLEPATQTTP